MVEKTILCKDENSFKSTVLVSHTTSGPCALGVVVFFRKKIHINCRGYKRPRVNRHTLFTPRRKGGLGTPDLQKYYYAATVSPVSQISLYSAPSNMDAGGGLCMSGTVDFSYPLVAAQRTSPNFNFNNFY